MRHRLLRGWWIIKHLFALTILSMMVILAVWQFQRLEQRRTANALQLASLTQSVIDGPAADDLAALVGRPVRISGSFLNEQSIVLRGQRSDNGVTGVHLITPLILDDGTAVLVNRGWLPSSQSSAAARAAYAVTTRQTITALVAANQLRPASPLAGRDLPLPGETRIDAWLRVDITALQQQISVPLVPVYLQQLPQAGQTGLPRPPDPRIVDEGPHFGYALQWLAFAAMLTVVYTALMVQEIRRDQIQR